MKLTEYLNSKKLTQSDFAAMIGCSQTHISLTCKGLRRPSPDLAQKIEAATGGVVTVLELLYPEHRDVA